MKVHAFLDTQIFLHYQFFEDIKWTSALSFEKVALIVAPIVLRELDEQKNGQKTTKRSRERARKVLARLTELWANELSAEIRLGVTIQHVLEQPRVDFDALGLNRDWADHQLIASIIAFREQLNSEDQVVLITRDSGPTLKARQYGIRTIRLSSNLELVDEADPETVRIRELERELREAKGAFPKLSITFRSGNNTIECMLPAKPDESAPIIETMMLDLRAKYPLQAYRKRLSSPKQRKLWWWFKRDRGTVGELLAEQGYEHVSDTEIDRYNEEIQRFFRTYEQYLLQLAGIEEFYSRALSLEMLLTNSGTAPAEDIDIFLHFPDGFALYTPENLPLNPQRPPPPQPPRTELEILQEGITRGFQNTLHYPPQIDYGAFDPPSNVSRPEIRRTNSYDVSISARRLKQRTSDPLEQMIVVFDSREAVGSFRIDYRINAANVPDEVTGQLHVILRREV